MANAAIIGSGGGGVASLYRGLHRGLRRGALHVREQLPARQRPVQLSGDLQRVQTYRRAVQRRREDRAIFEDGDGFLPAQTWLIATLDPSSQAEPTRLAGWRFPAGISVLMILETARSARPSRTGWVLRQNASFRTWPSTCHLACAPSLKKMTSPGP